MSFKLYLREGRVWTYSGQKRVFRPDGWNESKTKVVHKVGANTEEILHIQSLYFVQRVYELLFKFIPFNLHSSK